MAKHAIESRRRAFGAPAIFLACSVAVHAAVLVALPQFGHERELPGVAALEVVLLKADLTPAAPPEIAPQPSRRQSHTERVAAKALPQLQSERRAPALALSESRAAEGASHTAEPARIREPAVAAPEEKAPVDSVAVTPPSLNAAYLRNPAPDYPASARRAGTQGTVTLRVQVTREGLAARVDVEKSSGSPHLDAAALEAVKAWRFMPARRGVDAVESWMLVPIVFRLEGASKESDEIQVTKYR